MPLCSALQGMQMTNLSLLQISQEKSTSKGGRATQSASHQLHLSEKSDSAWLVLLADEPGHYWKTKQAAYSRLGMRTWDRAMFWG